MAPAGFTGMTPHLVASPSISLSTRYTLTAVLADRRSRVRSMTTWTPAARSSPIFTGPRTGNTCPTMSSRYRLSVDGLIRLATWASHLFANMATVVSRSGIRPLRSCSASSAVNRRSASAFVPRTVSRTRFPVPARNDTCHEPPPRLVIEPLVVAFTSPLPVARLAPSLSIPTCRPRRPAPARCCGSSG